MVASHLLDKEYYKMKQTEKLQISIKLTREDLNSL